MFLRQTLTPYKSLTPIFYCKQSNLRTENEFILPGTTAEADASIVFQLEEDDDPIWIDNIKLIEADITMNNPDDYIRFENNTSKVGRTIYLDDTYIDVKNTIYSGKVHLEPFSSLILIRKKESINIKSELKKSPKLNLNIYPNPAYETLNINISNDGGQKYKLEIFDTYGKAVVDKEISSLSNVNGGFQLDISSFNLGVYIVKVATERNIYCGRFLKMQ
ncbi:hypothetical protein D3C80_1072720 [compost metagenome]